MKPLQRYTCSLFLLFFLPVAALCQVDKSGQANMDKYYASNNRGTNFGGAFTFAASTGNLSKVADLGIGFHFLIDKEVTDMLGITGDVGWTNFFGRKGYSSSNAFSLEVGGKVKLSYVYIEGRTGYYFGDFDQFTFTPALGVRANHLDFNVGYQLAGHAKWFPFRIGYYFNE